MKDEKLFSKKIILKEGREREEGMGHKGRKGEKDKAKRKDERINRSKISYKI